MVVISPLVVARSQLLTAIDLFFNDRDPISVHALAGNTREILESLCRLAAVEPITELFLRDQPHKPKKDIYAALNLYGNCFKHVGKTWEDRKDGQIPLIHRRFTVSNSIQIQNSRRPKVTTSRALPHPPRHP